MVCIYCGNGTRVTNSRFQKRKNGVWRRRQCSACGAVFTSIEEAAYDHSLALHNGTSHIMPFQRDALFLSIYDACRHRSSAIDDATALAATVMAKLLRGGKVKHGQIERDNLVTLVTDTLSKFDTAASVQYTAFHPVDKR